MGILLSNQVCWAAFERVGLGGYSQAALSWMFRRSKLLWSLLLHVSILLILNKYNIKEGEWVGDDSDRQRAKITKRIFAASKIFDKKTGGWFNGQTVVLLFLVTGKVSLPVGFRFYQPDPAVTVWKKTDDALIAVIRGIVDAEDPHQKLDQIITVAKRLFPLRDSAKPMNGRDLGRLEPTPSLKYRAAACMT